MFSFSASYRMLLLHESVLWNWKFDNFSKISGGKKGGTLIFFLHVYTGVDFPYMGPHNSTLIYIPTFI